MMLSTYFRGEAEAGRGGTCPEGAEPSRGAAMLLVPGSVAAAPAVPQISLNLSVNQGETRCWETMRLYLH